MYETLRKHIEKTVSLSDEEFAWVQSHFSIKKYKRYQFIIQEGETVGYSYFIVSGLTKLVHHDVSGKSHIIAFAMEDWWESDFFAYLTQTRATLSLECIEDTEVLCISLANYRKLCADLQKVEAFFLEKAHFGNIAAQRRILSLLTSNAKERYLQLLKQYPQLVQRVPKSLLAAYLGVSRETLSRFSN
ncbi:Crp/Fnr family transcriptional regulator [Pedobacter agri]|uniref:Crp/Fnr family transcriptional regulator n=1 Tax=Pedobacter agri TaxID=454586 RepID=UPI00292E9A50|nr:Crp/Fnr family transcriptional regulator [Pedobacter agri]